MNSPCAIIFASSDQNRKCEEHFVFRDGREEEPTGREWQRKHVQRSGRIGLLSDEAAMKNGSRTAHEDP